MLLTIILFIAILSVLVFVHELGHYLSARKMGMGVDEFGLGFPPRLIGFQKLNKKGDNDGKAQKKWRLIKGPRQPKEIPGSEDSTIYSINWIPLGGFVKIKGEQGENSEEENSFVHKKIWQRMIVIAAGVVMNLIFAFVIISIGFSIGLPSMANEDLPPQAKISDPVLQIVQIQDETPASIAGVKAGDFIINVDGQTILTTSEFQNYTKTRINETLQLTVKRGSKELSIELIPQDIDESGEGKIGVYLAETAIVSYPWYLAIWMGLKTTISITGQIIAAFYNLISDWIMRQPIAVDIAGPIGIAALTGQVAQLGAIYILQFAAILSINLAIINSVPFPALDGGRFLFLIIEKIRGKAMNQRLENIINNTGFLILIGLVLLVTVQDISRFSDTIKSFFSNIF